MKNKKKIVFISLSVMILIGLTCFMTLVIVKNLGKKESILSTIDYLEKNYGDGDFIVTETINEEKNYIHSVETKYTDAMFKVTINEDNKVIKENFIDIYGLEAFDLKNYKNVLEYAYMTKINEINKKITDTLDATINYQTIKVMDNYNYHLKGKLPTEKDLVNSLEFEQPSIKFKKVITSEEDLLNEIKKAIKLLKVTLKDENIKYKTKYILYSFDNTTIESLTLVDNGYIFISDYDDYDSIRYNMFNKDLVIKKSDL